MDAGSLLLLPDSRGVAEKIKAFVSNCEKPILICSPEGKFSRESASVFTASGMPVFFTSDSVVGAAAVLCGGKKLVENHDGI